MSDYKQTRDAAGNITSQYGQMLRNLDDDLAVIGVDGIRRSFDEHYDTIREVEQDPTGAMWAIHKQADRIGELEAKLAKQENIIAAGKEMYETAMLTGGGSPVAWTAYVKARNTFGDILAELKGETE